MKVFTSIAKIGKLEIHWQIFIGLLLGILFGIFFKNQVQYTNWMGEVFMRAINMVIVPLMLTSIISGVSALGNSSNLGRLSLKTFSYYIVTSLMAILTGLFFVNLVAPGKNAALGLNQNLLPEGLETKSLSETLMQIVPDNIFEAFSAGDMLAIIFFSIMFGFFITKVSKGAQDFLNNFFSSSFEVVMKITLFIIKFSPIGVFSIVAKQVAANSDLFTLAKTLGVYMLVVLVGLFVHSAISLPLLVRILGRANPIKHAKSMQAPLLMAFSTCSSGATLSLTMESVEKKAGVSSKITGFVLPLGSTVNMDGTALYECVAAMFIAQAYGIELTYMEQFLIVLTSLLASIGAASIPMSGLVMLTIVLTSVGLPLEGVGLILAVDRVLDMFRTSVNVWSDMCGAVIIAKSEGETLNY